jgi:hypothetical protein
MVANKKNNGSLYVLAWENYPYIILLFNKYLFRIYFIRTVAGAES